jgi:hypothetical protein
MIKGEGLYLSDWGITEDLSVSLRRVRRAIRDLRLRPTRDGESDMYSERQAKRVARLLGATGGHASWLHEELAAAPRLDEQKSLGKTG